MSSYENNNGLNGKIKEFVEEVFPTEDVDEEDVEQQIWEDLSEVYYRYEDRAKKKAFRNVMNKICKKLCEGNWDSVYQRLYRENKYTN